jgi:hypothetical protein
MYHVSVLGHEEETQNPSIFTLNYLISSSPLDSEYNIKSYLDFSIVFFFLFAPFLHSFFFSFFLTCEKKIYLDFQILYK